MKIKHCLLITACLAAFNNVPLFAQAPFIDWAHTFGGSNYDLAESVSQTFDGGVIISGISTSTGGDVTGNHGAGDCWVVKLDAVGNLQWQKSYGGSADDGAFSIKQTADSGYIVAGTSTSSNGDVTLNHGFIDEWIIRLDALGNLQWQKSYGGSLDELAYDISQTKDKGYIIVGYTTSQNGDITFHYGFQDCWIVKTDSIGNIQWQRTYGGSQDDRAYSIQQTKDDGYIVAGYTESNNGDVSGLHGANDFWIFKLDSIGTLQWQKTLGGSLNDQAKSIQQTSDGGYITTGYTGSTNGDVLSNHGSEDIWLVKLDSIGTIEWQQSLGGSGVDQAYQVKQLSDNGYILAGSSYSLDGDVTGNQGGTDCWVVRTDNLGNILWEESLGGSSFEEAYSVALTPGNGYVIAGGTLSTDGDVIGNHGDFDYWALKLTDPIATEITFIGAYNKCITMNLAPNPCASNFLISYQLTQPSDVAIEIYNVTGQKIISFKKQNQQKGLHTLPVDTHAQLASGIYMVRIIAGREITERRLIKE